MIVSKSRVRNRKKTAKLRAKLKRKNKKRILRMAGLLKGRRNRGRKNRFKG